MPAWLHRYRLLPKHVLRFTAGLFLINLINASQFLLLNLFLKARGLDDPAIAALTSHRFLAHYCPKQRIEKPALKGWNRGE